MDALILIVEDEQDILELMEYHLGKEGFETIGFLNTKRVQEALEEENVDLILMDRNLPGAEGSEFVDMLRKKGVQTPVIFVSAKHKDEDIEQGFERGGDDYITKPFSMKELVLRVRAILRRTKKLSMEGSLVYRDMSLNLAARTLTIEGTPVELTKLEFDLLHALIANQNVVLDRDYLLEHVWSGDEIYQERTVNVAINRLKEKIDPDKTKDYIKTVRGVGYTLC
ncbi:MAG: chemotaxis protein CheY [Sulfuricurvum sp. MLSB]|uniref:response regulator transcription factor n=1 Tax=unclassified Sulfuricurvum TaxID=2632390 RepID=UPI00050431F8|nr:MULTISPECIES: response regulator transcription factor [unclassified Sulfuricurvum]KFN40433.1 MAG: chemotaxis protein CheY [Sulfuricurvum sp. MLSB]